MSEYRLPPKLKINGKWWKIRRRSLKHQVIAKGKVVHKRYFGLTDYSRRTITLSWGIDDNNLLATYIHELVHATVPDLDEDATLRLEATLMAGIHSLDGKPKTWKVKEREQ